jgi:hypothetical protein
MLLAVTDDERDQAIAELRADVAYLAGLFREHEPQLRALLDNPAAKWALRRKAGRDAVHQNGAEPLPVPVGAQVHR